ncbi:transmembrane amino acid transporter protein-domain-containing protein [Dichotomopilus funicola]|uniref:Transmembrane amino acid transporter protein-domain-containing protein n=1 Tax=Dichotomopilus funicola TaxID=1934379 RepID=A0AAN6ZLS3_9PEZI|nr:transmembrane amino acid transporter protein-domain-containing protein [Dichotomopilus funicola]
MASDTQITGVGLDASSEKKMNGDLESNIDANSTRIEPASIRGAGETDNEGAVEINYHTLTWWQAGVVLVAETVSLGILSLPGVVANLGLAPGIVVILIMGAFSTYSGLVMGEFRRQYPWVQSFGDAGEIIGRSIGMGKVFQELFGWAQTIFQIFVMGSHLLTWTICLNTLTSSAACTIIWGVIGLGVFWLLNTPRTLRAAGYYSFASFASIFTAVMVTMIDVGIEKPIGSTAVEVSRTIGFSSAFLSVTNIAVAFSGHSCFFTVMSEFKNPSDWPKALFLLQICDTVLYLVVSIVIYIYVGPDVPSPALSAAGSTVVRKVIWGLAIPTIVIAGVIYGHVAAKYIFVRVFANTKHLATRTTLGRFGWLGITAAIWTLAWIIAESIPVFSNLLGLVAALFASWFSYGIPGMLWLWMHYGNWFSSPKKVVYFSLNAMLVLIGVVLCALGLWSTGEAIAKDSGTTPWSCKSNAA